MVDISCVNPRVSVNLDSSFDIKPDWIVARNLYCVAVIISATVSVAIKAYSASPSI